MRLQKSFPPSSSSASTKTSSKKRQSPEHEIQAGFFSWAEQLLEETPDEYPELAYLYAIPNGGGVHIATRLRLHREGLRAGVPDVHLPVPSPHHLSLYLEFKAPKGRISPEQREWHARLRLASHAVVVPRSTPEAIASVLAYLDGARVDPLAAPLEEMALVA
jgi:hypothetical protein